MLEGRCSCGQIHYRLNNEPLIVHCCHCTWCQRESGAAFAINALIEVSELELVSGVVDWVDTPSNSGSGQLFARCPTCRVALWSYYGGGKEICFVRVGTLADPNHCPPDIHIFTSTKQAWVQLPEETPAVEEYYQRSKYWRAESIARRDRALGKG